MQTTLPWIRVSLGKIEHYYSATDRKGNLWELEPTISDAWVIRKNDKFVATIEGPDAVSRAKACVELMIRQRKKHGTRSKNSRR